MTDIVERLRETEAADVLPLDLEALMVEAADEIDRLRRELDAARHWISQTGKRLS